MIKIKSMCVALNLFCFGHFFPISKISTPAKVIVAAIHSARATAAKLEIMDGFAFDDISTFFASDCVSSNSRHNQSLFSAFLIFSFSPLPSVRRRSSGTAHFSKMEFFFISRSACLLLTLWIAYRLCAISSLAQEASDSCPRHHKPHFRYLLL